MAEKVNAHRDNESATPIIDAHVHIFNALDIPVEGYLRSRSPDIVDFILPNLFTYLTDRMRDRCVLREQVNQYGDLMAVVKSMAEEESPERFAQTAEEEALGEYVSPEESLDEYVGTPKDESVGLKWLYTILLKVFSVYMWQRLDLWEKALTKDAGRLAGDLLDIDWGKRVDLYVPLMVDYEYWFKNTLDHDLESQIQDIYENAVIPNQGRIHPFVPFDPARQLVWEKRDKMLTPDGQRPKYSSLDLVKDAIENKGFIGVKLYNSLGYKPIGNNDLLTPLRRKRIAVRNGKMPYLFPDVDYDRVLWELYEYCAEEQIPITTHCQTGGIEAYPEASFDFCDPVFWREVLDKYKDLRLNLGHFGWGQKQGYKNESDNWVRKICEMIIKYDHLYADVSHHNVVSSSGRRKHISSYEAMRNDYAGKGLEKLKKRILYGSDWHVLKRVKNFEIFMAKYIQVMEQASFYTKEEMENFLGGNALEFLGLLPGGKNRERLKDFYAKEKIPPPYWFTSTASQKPSA
jgi:predicted TIM-barrel fold metal-dependent hydrolase